MGKKKKKEDNDKDGDADAKTDDDGHDKEIVEDGDKKERDSDKDKEERDDKKERRDRDSKDRDRDKKKKDKMITCHPQLLLAFVYFDQSHCGYILDKDIEELMYALGLNLSRAQVRRLVQAVITKDSRDSRESREALHYRRLTDKMKVEENGTSENSMDVDHQPANLEKLAFGNKRLLPVFASHQGGSPPSKRARLETSESVANNDVPEGFVMFKGGLLDVEKLLSQLKRSEKARSDTENMLISLRDELNDVKKAAASSSHNVKHLTSELKDFKDRLQNTSDELSKVQAKSSIYLSTFKDIQVKISKVVTVKSESVAVKLEPSNEDETARGQEM